MPPAKCVITMDGYDIRALIASHLLQSYGITVDNQDVVFADEDGEDVSVESVRIKTELVSYNKTLTR